MDPARRRNRFGWDGSAGPLTRSPDPEVTMIRDVQLTVSLFHPADAAGPQPAVGYAPDAAARAVNWPAVIASGLALLLAVRSRNVPAILAAVRQLLADLGIDFPGG